MEKRVLYYGSKEPLPGKVKLRAGNLDLVYENGFIRYIRNGPTEIIRMINHAVRDRNWGTAPFTIANEQICSHDDSFEIEYTALVDTDEIRFEWNCRIIGKEDSSVEFSIEGRAASSFLRNRVGFTVLHPIRECVGQKVKITHPDGKISDSIFPELISPHQPFRDIQSMEWEANGINSKLTFEGEVFEAEDQRNWIDDSYKTYCTPLDLPFPVRIEKGEVIKQRIILNVTGREISDTDESSGNTFSISDKAFRLPKIGIGQSSEVDSLNDREKELLKAVQFDHYQADLRLYEKDWIKKWQRIVDDSKALGLPLELSLFFDDVETEIELFIEAAKKESASVSIINVFNKSPHSTQKETLNASIPQLRKAFPQSAIGAGTNAFFTELNRDRTPGDLLDFLVYSINPQVHAFDNDSLCETLNAIPYTVKSARAFSENKPIHISPITFKMRWNPNATGEIAKDPNILPDNVDVRQMSLFGAAWLVGLINEMITTRVEAITCFETVGLKGIMQSSKPLYSHHFLAEPESIYPMYYIFKAILNNKSARFFHVKSSDPLKFSGLAWGEESPEKLLLVSFQSATISLQLPDSFTNCQLKAITSENIHSMMTNPELQLERTALDETELQLPPYALLLISVH